MSERAACETGLPLLFGDGVENACNALTMTHAAAMFGWDCAFRDRAGLEADWRARALDGTPDLLSVEELQERCEPLVAFDNAQGAQTIYGFKPGPINRLALAVGNERRGLAADILRVAKHSIQVPMASKRVNCLNVAAAAAVGMYCLSRGGGGKMYTRANPHRNRPELLLLGGGDHVELGSTIRSAAAFGWNRAFVEDRAGVWFGCDRVVRSQGRAAARRGKNAIRLVPTATDRKYAFEEACVVTVQSSGQPLGRANLARGPRQLVVLADEEHVDWDSENLDRFARSVRFVQLDVPNVPSGTAYHYRLTSTIALAEIARQVGVHAPKARRGPRPPIYDHTLELLLEEAGETVLLQDLDIY